MRLLPSASVSGSYSIVVECHVYGGYGAHRRRGDARKC